MRSIHPPLAHESTRARTALFCFAPGALIRLFFLPPVQAV